MVVGVLSGKLSFTPVDIHLVDRGRYTSVQAVGAKAEGTAGSPALPWRTFSAVVPEGARPTGLNVGLAEYGPLAEPLLIEPVQPLEPSPLAHLAIRVSADPEFYGSTVAFPGEPARVRSVRHVGPYTVVDIAVCPVRYWAASHRLELLTHLEWALAYEAPDGAREPVGSADERAYVLKVADRLRRIVINPDDVSRHGPDTDVALDVARVRQVTHVIITNDNLAGTFAGLSRWRNQLGMSSQVVLRNDIIANHVPGTGGATFNQPSGYYDGGTRDDAEAIRNFVKWAAIHWNTDFVLLGGDTDVIPERHAIATREGKIYAGGDFQKSDMRTSVGTAPLASSEVAGSPAHSVVDDDHATAWRCASEDPDPWIRLEMRPRRPINHVTLVWGSGHATGYRLAVSDDASTWTDVHVTSTGPPGTVDINFPAVMATFARLQITSGAAYSLERLAVFGPALNSSVVISGGTATRIYMDYHLTCNPTNQSDRSRVLLYDGPFAGTVIPYDENSDETVLGWHFIVDPLMPSTAVSPTPTMFMEIRGPLAFHGHMLVVADEALNLIPTDLYYGDVAAGQYTSTTDHDWDHNRNLVYGEQFGDGLDGVNGYADVHVGRAPVSSEGEAGRFVDKVIHYEKYIDEADQRLTPEFAVSMMLGSQNWYVPDPHTIDDSAAGKEDIRRTYRAAAPGRFLFTRRYEDFANVPPADQGPDLDTADTGRIVAGIQLPSHAVSLTSHGAPGYLCYLTIPDVQTLGNPPGIWYGNACLTNMFDVTPGECVGEELLLNRHGGAVAYVGYSRWGHVGDNAVELAFWEAMLHPVTVGEMFAACKRMCDNPWEQYAINLLGDPAMRVWNDRPTDLEIGVRPFELCVGRENVMSVSVFGSGPLPGAVVVVSQNGARLGIATTGRDGTTHITVHPPSVGQVDIAVFGENLIPELRQLPVLDCGGQTGEPRPL